MTCTRRSCLETLTGAVKVAYRFSIHSRRITYQASVNSWQACRNEGPSKRTYSRYKSCLGKMWFQQAQPENQKNHSTQNIAWPTLKGILRRATVFPYQRACNTCQKHGNLIRDKRERAKRLSCHRSSWRQINLTCQRESQVVWSAARPRYHPLSTIGRGINTWPWWPIRNE